MPLEQRRLTAIKTDLKTIQSGQYVKQDGFNPNFIQSRELKLSRVRVLGTVVSVFISDDGRFGSVTLDDSTETIRLKAFKDLTIIKDISPGDLVDVIGKVREYNGEKYVMPEIIRKVEPDFELLRKVELARQNTMTRTPETMIKPQIARTETTTPKSEAKKPEVAEAKKGEKDVVLAIIVDLDEGEGAEYSEILGKCDLPPETIDKVINDLLSDGTCYEPRPGRIKKL